MQLGLTGKVALVAAASKGLGREVATQLAAEGVRVAICARHEATLAQTAAAIREATRAEVLPLCVDLSQPEGPRAAVDGTLAKFGGLDLLVTNTGGPVVGSFLELDEGAWQAAADLVLLSAVRLIRAAAPQMVQRGDGRIVNIASISAKEPIANLVLSNAYRAALIGLGKTLATELGPRGIRVNTVCPGKIATDRVAQLDLARATRTQSTADQVRAEAEQRIPLGRYGEPRELAQLVVFLLSDAASYVTGTTVLCDGGLYSGLM